MMNYLSEQEFLNLTRQGNLIPVFKEIHGDLETPVSAYHKLAATSRYSFLLESVEGQEKFARFSFIARDPELVLQVKGQVAEVLTFKGAKVKSTNIPFQGSPLNILREYMKDYQAVQVKGLPQFYGGMVGYLSYDAVRYFERLPNTSKDDLKLPDMCFMLARDLVVFDHRHHKLQLISCVSVDPKASKAHKVAQYRKAMANIAQLEKDLNKNCILPKNTKSSTGAIKLKSNYTQREFEQMVITSKKNITAGDIFQIVLSQRFEVPIKKSAFDIYRSLRVLNPSPYMFFLNLNGFHLVGASPELLVRCINGVVETRPIAGTRWRGKNDDEDKQLAEELLNDPKEKAEHIMLVDLGRNDIGRVCQQGSVKLTDFMTIERYSHVMHIASNVQGILRKDKDALDALQAAFPAGTVSGAPKIRAMEIIEALEKQKRGPYAGAVGYVSFSKNLDTCITIRTIVVRANKAYVQAGAGIVADSNPASEYKESVNKAKGQIKAIENA